MEPDPSRRRRRCRIPSPIDPHRHPGCTTIGSDAGHPSVVSAVVDLADEPGRGCPQVVREPRPARLVVDRCIGHVGAIVRRVEPLAASFQLRQLFPLRPATFWASIRFLRSTYSSSPGCGPSGVANRPHAQGWRYGMPRRCHAYSAQCGTQVVVTAATSGPRRSPRLRRQTNAEAYQHGAGNAIHRPARNLPPQ